MVEKVVTSPTVSYRVARMVPDGLLQALSRFKKVLPGLQKVLRVREGLNEGIFPLCGSRLF